MLKSVWKKRLSGRVDCARLWGVSWTLDCNRWVSGVAVTAVLAFWLPGSLVASSIRVKETDKTIEIETSKLKAEIRKQGYVSGVGGGTFLDKETGFRDAGFGLHIVDFLLEPGSDRAYRDQLRSRMVYHYGDKIHGARAKRKVEGPQICTMAKRLDPKIIEGDNFVAIRWTYRYKWAAPQYKPGSTWTQTLVFPEKKRFFISSDRIHSVNANDSLFARIDMPGHIKHEQGDTFSSIYLSYHGTIRAKAFSENFAPDERFNYRRDQDEVPDRMIRAYRLRNAENGSKGPWLAGMTLDPTNVYEAWCHQRGYVSMIQEIGGRPIKAGGTFGAAYVVGYFDSIKQMESVYDRYKGHDGLQVDDKGWELTRMNE